MSIKMSNKELSQLLNMNEEIMSRKLEGEVYINKVLCKMCEFVKVDPKTIDFKKDNWFLKHSWNHKQETKFIEWMTNYLYTNRKARTAILDVPIKHKGRIREAVKLFVFDAGWKRNDVTRFNQWEG